MMSSAHPGEAADAPAAPSAGADLRAARERLGWDLAAMAGMLRIRAAYLEALEQGLIDLLPGNAYALGFLRTYAAALGLDPDEMARRFKEEAAEVTRRTELAFPAPVPERGLPAGALVLLGLVLAMGAYAGWYRLSGEGRLPPETLAIPERLAPLAQQALPPQAPPATAENHPAMLAAKPAAEPEPAPAEPAPPVPSVSPASAAAAQVPAFTPPPPAAPPDPAQPSADQADPVRLTLRASADAWVQVREKAGPILLNRILHAGETWPVPARANLLLTTGNAGGTELVVDGASTGVLGGQGVVRRDLPLDPDLVKAGRLAPVAANAVQPAGLRAGQ